MKKLLTKKLLALMLLVSVIFISGCESTMKTSLPVSPEDLTVSVEPLIIKEFNEQEISLNVLNGNGTQAIDSVSVSSFDPFTIVGQSHRLIFLQKTRLL